jgi:hypothetical protein
MKKVERHSACEIVRPKVDDEFGPTNASIKFQLISFTSPNKRRLTFLRLSGLTHVVDHFATSVHHFLERFEYVT